MMRHSSVFVIALAVEKAAAAGGLDTKAFAFDSDSFDSDSFESDSE